MCNNRYYNSYKSKYHFQKFKMTPNTSRGSKWPPTNTKNIVQGEPCVSDKKKNVHEVSCFCLIFADARKWNVPDVLQWKKHLQKFLKSHCYNV